MVVALLTRRAQMLSQNLMGSTDFLLPSKEPWMSASDPFHLESQNQSRAVLRLVYVLENGLSSKMSPRSAIDWALARGPLIEDLKNAVLGNYQYILQLVSVIQNGSEIKRILDEVINRCKVDPFMISCFALIPLHYR
jgi:hypothetical protein